MAGEEWEVRILHVNKFLHRRGGAEGYMEDVAALQAEAGHQVAFFAMQHPLNRPSRYESHFPEYLELAPPPSSLGGKARAVARILYSRSARQGFDEVIDDFDPDVVHLHNIYEHLSPSILGSLGERDLASVMTLHDYKLACPTYRFLDHGALCQACVGGRFHQAVLRRCKDDSLAASAMCALELFVHTRTHAYAPVRRFICPSGFMEGRMMAAGVYPDRLRCVSHFVDAGSVTQKEEPGGGVVFAGRLSHEKGVDVLIEAIAGLGRTISLDIAGDGPQRQELEVLSERTAAGRVRFHGRLTKARLQNLIRSASLLAMPSRWYENQPMIVLEAFACGVPVVGTVLGGIPELVEDGVDGALIAPDDPAALADAIEPLLRQPAVAFSMGRAARDKVERHYSPSAHIRRLGRVYDEALMARSTASD